MPAKTTLMNLKQVCSAMDLHRSKENYEPLSTLRGFFNRDRLQKGTLEWMYISAVYSMTYLLLSHSADNGHKHILAVVKIALNL